MLRLHLLVGSYAVLSGFAAWPSNELAGRMRLAEVGLALLVPTAIAALWPWRHSALDRLRRPTVLDMALISWLVAVAVAGAVNDRYADVAVSAGLGAVYLFLTTVTSAVDENERLRVVLDSLLVAGTVHAAVAISMWASDVVLGLRPIGIEQPADLTYPVLGELTRATGTTTTPTMLATLLTFPIIVAAARLLSGRAGRLEYATVGFAAPALLLTASKSLLVVAIGILCLLALEARRPTARRFALTTGAVTVLLLVAVTHLTPSSPGRPPLDELWARGVPVDRVTLAQFGDSELVTTGYSALKSVGLDMWQQRPLTGVGPGGFHPALEQLRPPGARPPGDAVYDPHSTYVGALAETGVIGVAALGAVAAAAVQSARRALRMGTEPGARADAVALTACLAALAVEAVSTDVLSLRWVWILFAGAAAWSPAVRAATGVGHP